MPANLGGNLIVRDSSGVNRTITVRAMFIALAPLLLELFNEWTGKDFPSYVRFKVGLRTSQFKNQNDND